MSSDNKFFSKLKHTFKGDKEKESTRTPSSPESKRQENVLNEAHKEGENLGAASTAAGSGAGTSTGTGAGVGAGAAGAGAAGASTASKTGNKEHDNILKEAWDEGEKLFHHHAKTGKTGGHSGSGAAAAGAAAGGAGGYAAGNAHPRPTGSSEYGTGADDVIASSSKGRVVSQPPIRSRQPLDHEVPGDFSNSKNPTDPTVLAQQEGARGSKQSGTRPDETFHDNSVLGNTNPSYSDDARPAQGHGKFFDPRDTQGGVLGAATSSPAAASAYNRGDYQADHQEATKAKYVDTDHLKTKPTAYEQRDRENAFAEKVEDEAYQEGNKQGRKDTKEDPSLLGARQVGGAGTTADKEEVDPQAVHQQNKSAYNADGVSGILNKEKGHTGHSAGGDHDPAQAQAQAQQPNVIHTGNTAIGGPGVASAKQDNYDPVATDRKISDLDKEISETDRKIKELRSEPSNASTYAVRDEAIKTPNVSGVADDDYDQHEFTNAKTDKNTNDNASQGAGVLAGAGGALAAAAGYLGLNKSSEHSDSHNIESIKKDAYDAGFQQGRDLYEGLGHGQGSHVSAAQAQDAKKGAYEKGVQSGAYDQGEKKAEKENQGPGIVEEAKHAVEGAAAAAAGYLGFGAASGNEKEGSGAAGSTTVKDKAILDESYKAGQDKFKKEQAETLHSRSTGQDGTPQEGILGRAEHAIEGTAAAAASYLGLSGATQGGQASQAPSTQQKEVLNKSHDEGKKKEVLDESYDKGKQQFKNDQAHTGATPISKDQTTAGGDGNVLDKAEKAVEGAAFGAAGYAGYVAHAVQSKAADFTSGQGSSAGASTGTGAGTSAVTGASAGTGASTGAASSSKYAKESDVRDSLIEDAEKVDPEIEKLPPHKVNKKELAEEESFGPDATAEEEHTVYSNKVTEGEKNASKWNKEHGFVEPTSNHPTEKELDVRDSLIEDAEKADPSIAKVPAHKQDKKKLKEEETLAPDATEEEKSTIAKSQFKEIEDDVAAYNKKHGFTSGSKKSLIDVAEESDPSIEKLSPHHGKSIDQEGTTKSTDHGSDVQALPAGAPQVTTQEIKESLGVAHGGDASSARHRTPHKGSLSSGKDDKSSKKSVGSGSGTAAGATSTPSSSSSSSSPTKKQTQGTGYGATPAHNSKDVSGAAFNSTQPLGSEKKEDNVKKALDPRLKQEVYESGYESALGDLKSKNHGRDATAGTAGAAGAGGFVASLDHKLKKELYDHGFRKGTTDHTAGVGSGKTDASKSDLHPSLKQELFELGHAKGRRDLQGQQKDVVAGDSRHHDSKFKAEFEKLKRDLFEHGYAKGSTENKKARDNRAHGTPYGSSNKEAAAIGAGAGAYGASRHANEYGQPAERANLDRNSELVGESTAHKRGQDNEDNLVVEVIGIEDKDEALKTARNASKKLDERGVDLTTGKLVIDANNKEIYKEEYVSAREVPGQGYGHGHDLVGVAEILGQARAAGYVHGHTSHRDTTYKGAGVGQKTGIVPDTLGQSRAAGYTHGSQYEPDTRYEGSGAGQTTKLVPDTLGQSRAAGYTHGSQYEPDTRYEGTGAGQRTELVPGQGKEADESELARKRLHDAARRNAGISSGTAGAGAGVGAATGAAAGGLSGHGASKPATVPSSKSTKGDDDEIFVNVKGIKDNAVATKLARAAVARLQKTHGSVIAKVKELQVDASSGAVRDENGREIARYEDLTVEGASSRSSSRGSTPKKTSAASSTAVPSAIPHSPIQARGGTSGASTGAATGAATGAGVGGLAAAAARDASSKHHGAGLTEPTHHTQANTKYDYQNQAKVQSPYPSGNPAVNQNYSSKDTYGSGYEKGRPVDKATGYGVGSGSGSGYDSSKIHSSGHSKDVNPALSHRTGYDESKIHSSGHSKLSNEGYGSSLGYSSTAPQHTNVTDEKYLHNTHGQTGASGGYSSPSQVDRASQGLPESTTDDTNGLPTYSNYDAPGSTSHSSSGAAARKGESTSSDGLSGLASSIVGASGLGGALASLGVTDGNKSAHNDTTTGAKTGAGSDQHLSGSNAYPKSAVHEYSSNINDTSGHHGQAGRSSHGSSTEPSVNYGSRQGSRQTPQINPVSSPNYVPESTLKSATSAARGGYPSGASGIAGSSSGSGSGSGNVPRDFDATTTASEYIKDGGLDDKKTATSTSDFAKPATTATGSGATGDLKSEGLSSTTAAPVGQPATTNTAPQTIHMPGGWI
ncbi:uncharacterized protein LODBEIA_P03240 [Lodderomyces beijingensis]|uniref:Uncharacterized protein n=1 Tax=Lodderomyces beijingensis TaxID=1775926 RepID=A0ABP0ZD44_9ASCO